MVSDRDEMRWKFPPYSKRESDRLIGLLPLGGRALALLGMAGCGEAPLGAPGGISTIIELC